MPRQNERSQPATAQPQVQPYPDRARIVRDKMAGVDSRGYAIRRDLCVSWRKRASPGLPG